MKTGPKIILFLALFVGVVFGLRKAAPYLPLPEKLKSMVPQRTEEISADVIQHNTAVKPVALPKTVISTAGGPEIRYLLWAWNAQMGAMFANGGVVTTQGSLVEKQGVKIRFIRQDDPAMMQNELVAFATQLEKGNTNPSSGAHFVAIMGDGAAAFLQAINPRLEKMGPEYIAEVVGSAGYSRGEDKFMGLPAWKANPQAAKGALIAGVLRDGDWNIAMRWAQINDIPNNPDEKTWDPNALNWVATDTFTDAAQKYISGYCEERPVKGNRSEKKRVCVNGSVTWTPGDVTIAEKKGGLVSLLSTKDAIFQMPNTIIGIRKWNQLNPDKVAGMLAAWSQGADQVRTSKEALMKAAEVSTAVYKEQTPIYWARYYAGFKKPDLTGMEIELGGSYVNNMADMRQLFGMDGGPNIFKATYETWGNVVVQQYPNIMKEFPPTDKVVNTQYILAASGRVNMADVAPVEKQTYSASTPVSTIIGQRDYSIEFDLGKATIRAVSNDILNTIVSDLVTSNTTVILHGHTDNTGTPEGNIGLSRARAESVKQFLMSRGKTSVPGERVRVVPHGQDEPIADNATVEGRAKNRRVQVVLGK